MKNFFKKNGLALILSVAVGFLVVMPTVFSITKIGWNNFQGIYPILTDDEEYYLTRTREVIDGHIGLGNVYLKEHKREPYLAPPLAEIILAKSAQTLNISVPTLFTINDFLFPFLVCLLLYFLFNNLSGSKEISAWLSFLFVFLYIRELGRPINQQFSLIFLILGLYVVLRIYKNGNGLKSIILNNFGVGLFFGILLYIYPYFWTTLLVAYGLALSARFIREKKLAYFLKNLISFLSIAFIFSLPYILNLIKAMKLDYYAETSQRLGIINTYWPSAYYNAFFVFIALLVVWLANKYLGKKELYFSYALALAGIILNWQNAITGKYLWFSSHYNMATIFLLLIALAPVFVKVFSKDFWAEKLKSKLVIFSLLLIFFFSLFYLQAPSVRMTMATGVSKEEMENLQKLRPVFDWFNRNTLKDSVVLYLVGNKINLLPIYTHNNLYSFGYAGLFLIKNQELEERWIRQNLLNVEFNEEFIRKNLSSPSINFIPAYQNTRVRKKIIAFLIFKKYEEEKMIPDEFISKLVEEYKEAKQEGPEKTLKKYDLDYILLDLNVPENREIKEEISNYDFIKPLIEIENNLIYKVE